MSASTVWTLLLATASLVGAADVVIKPTTVGKPQIGIVFIEGAQIAPEAYIPVLQAIVQPLQASYSVYIGAPQFLGSVPEPLQMDSAINSILDKLQHVGLSKSAPVFYGAHSLGGVMLQDYLKSHASLATAQFLLGSYIQRKYDGTAYPVPTLTVGGELDGLTRITRIAEAYQTQLLTQRMRANENFRDYPVVCLEGVSHMQFATGTPPKNVLDNDLKPEISDTDARTAIAQAVSTYIVTQLTKKGDKRGAGLTPAHMRQIGLVMKTGTLLDPLIMGMNVEGSYHTKPPCDGKPASDDCRYGSTWTPLAQESLGSSGDFKYTIKDQFIHIPTSEAFPTIYNSCDKPQGCILNTTTITQNVYGKLDPLDIALYPVTADEIRAKLNSRQFVLQSAGLGPQNFTVTDGKTNNLCGKINQMALDYGVKNAAPKSLARYQKYGRQYVIGDDDGPLDAGPLWIYTGLKYTKGTSSSGGLITTVQSPFLSTSMTFPVHSLCCKHYCKLLSPARVLEWMYVDSLRDKLGLSS